MEPPKKNPRWRRRLLRAAGLLLGLALIAAVWVLFFPVPLGWVARFGLARAFPAEGPLQLKVEAVTFRWRWGQPALAVEVRGIDAAARGRPLATVRSLWVDLPKAGAWQRHFAPARIEIHEPHLTIDQTSGGALALLSPPPAAGPVAVAPAPSSPPPGAAPDLAALGAVLPPPGGSTQLAVTGLQVELRNGAGEVRLPFGRIETTLTQTTGGLLQLDVSLPLTAAAKPPQLTAHAALEMRTGRAEFAVKLPAFATSDLPVLPGAPPLPLQATVALDVAGHFDLTAFRLEDIAGGVSISDGDLTLPPPVATKLHLESIELRGRADFRAQRAVLETGRVRIGTLEINVAEFETTLGAKMQSRWQVEIVGLKGSAVLPLLRPATRTLLPEEAFNLASLARATTRGTATVQRDAAGVWSSGAMDAEGRIELALGPEPLALTWSARQPEGADTLALDLSLPAFVPARWPAELLPGIPLSAIDLPLAFAAHAVVTPTGVPRSARLALTSGPGTLRPLQPGRPPLAVRGLDVRVETEQFDRAWRVPVARLELANGATAELTGVEAGLTPGQFAVQGEARATGFSGAFIALWLPADTWAPLTAAGLAPRDVLLDRLGARFSVRASAQAGGGWQPSFLATTADARLRLHEVPLNFTAQFTLPEAGKQITATVDLAEFRPALLGLTLPNGLTTAAFDFPLSLHATAQAGLGGELAAAGVQLRVGAGRLRTPVALGGVDLAVNSLALDASYDPPHGRVAVQSLRLDAGGLRLSLSDLTATLAAPHAISGKLDLEPFSLATALALWPESQQPELRRTVQTTLRSGEFLGAQADWNVAFDPAAPTALQLTRVHAVARLGKLEALPAGLPGPVTLAGLNATLDYPQATVELRDLALPGGARVPTARVQANALNTPAPNANVTASFAADLVAANRVWKFAPPDVLNGSVQGELTVQTPFTGDLIEVGLALDLTRVKYPLPGFTNAAPDKLNATVRLAHALSPDLAPTADFTLAAGAWLGTPLRMAGRVALTAGDHRPTLVELTSYVHGRTQLQAKVALPSDQRMEVAVTGANLDLVPLLRAGLAAADAFAALPVAGAASPAPSRPAPAVAAATPPPKQPLPTTAPPRPSAGAPMTVSLDAHIDQIEFGPGQNARQLELHTQLTDNWPSVLTLQTVAGPGNALHAELGGPADRQTFKLTIGDAANWLRTITAPWSAQPPAPGQFGSLVAQLAKVPYLVAGGGIDTELELRRGEPEWLHGHFDLTRATLVRPPRVLQLLALKSGRALQQSPLIEKFSIGQLTLSRTLLRVDGIALGGSGLFNNLKIKSASYGLDNDRLKVDGEYFGVGFDVIGTLADPQVFLKDSNKLIRALGTRNEFDFDDEPAAKPKKP